MMVQKAFTILATLLVTITVLTASLEAQVIKVKPPSPPKIPTKPPTVDDIKREANNAGKKADEAWDKVKNLDPKGASEEAWGEAGRRAYTSAARVMSKRSPTGERLDKNMKNKLRDQ